MRILDLTTLYLDGGDGGVNTYLTEKARYIARRREAGRRRHGFENGTGNLAARAKSSPRSGELDHVIVVSGSSTRLETLEGSRLHVIRSPSLPGNPEHRVLADLGAVARILREERPDVVEVDCSYFLARVARHALAEVPLVGLYHVHLPRLYARDTSLRWRTRLARSTLPLAWRYSEWCARPCDRLVVTSREIGGLLEKARFPPVSHVPLGVNLDLFRPAARRPRALDNGVTAGLDPHRPIVLYVGRLSPEKDLEVLLRAHEILERQDGAQLLICGDGPLRPLVERATRTSPNVFALGRVAYGEELASLYNVADVLAVPGRYEAFGLVVLEALASGLGVVAAACGGPTETLRGHLGRWARPGDAEDFARQLRLSLELDARDPAARSARREHVRENYSWTRTFDHLFQIYRSLLR